MPKSRIANAVRLEFEPGAEIHTNLSGAAFSGEWLWVVGDEACTIECLQRLPPVGNETLRFGAMRSFPLASLVELPGDADEEADLEGLALADGQLWAVGSHGLKRRNVKAGRDAAENAERLAKLSLDANRRLLVSLPVELDLQGRPCLVREAADGRRARRLAGTAKRNAIIDLLADDDHYGPFLKIPGKDNGFDIEGLAVDGQRVLLGLRGPVLRGWTGLLEIAVAADGGTLKLVPLDAAGTLLRKHFLQLKGLGIRDLHLSGDDLYLLAGPTMVLDGDIRVFHWRGARSTLAANREPVRFETGLVQSILLPHGHGSNRAEALCDLPRELAGATPSWLVLYDAPAATRREGENVVFGDLLQHA